jgi:hypothetical protein
MAILSLMRPNSPIFRPNARRSLQRSRLSLQEVARRAHAAGGQAEAPVVEHLHGHLEALASLAEHVVDGHAHVVEVDGGGRRASNAELALVGAGAHAHASLDEEGGDLGLGALAGRARAREHGEQVGEAPVGDPDLRAVQQVVRAVGGELGLGAYEPSRVASPPRAR